VLPHAAEGLDVAIDHRLVLRDERARLRGATVDGARSKRAIDVAEQSLRVSKQARDLAAEADRLTRVGYERGQGTSLELVTAANALRQADVNLALQEFAVVRARVSAALTYAQCKW